MHQHIFILASAFSLIRLVLFSFIDSSLLARLEDPFRFSQENVWKSVWYLSTWIIILLSILIIMLWRYWSYKNIGTSKQFSRLHSTSNRLCTGTFFMIGSLGPATHLSYIILTKNIPKQEENLDICASRHLMSVYWLCFVSFSCPLVSFVWAV